MKDGIQVLKQSRGSALLEVGDMNSWFADLQKRFAYSSGDSSVGEDTAEEEEERCELPRGLHNTKEREIELNPESMAKEREREKLWEEALEFVQPHRIRMLRKKLVVFPENLSDLNLFDSILMSRVPTYKEAVGRYLSQDHSVAILKVMYGQQLDVCLVYSLSETSEAKKATRKAHLKTLLDSNLILTLSFSCLDANDIFVEVVAPFQALAWEAELKGCHFPLKKAVIQRYIPDASARYMGDASNWSRFWNGHLQCPKYDVHKRKRSAKFTLSTLSDFEKGGDSIADARLDFFSPGQRNHLINSIICRCTTELRGQIGEKITVHHLIKQGVYKDYFPLHDGTLRVNTESQRALLKRWSDQIQPSLVPLDAIRWYFGEENAFYFAFVAFYTQWLLMPAIIGFMAFVYGLVNTTYSGSYMSIFDNRVTGFFAILLSIWSICFLKCWKRRSHELAFLWDQDHFKKEVHVRSDWKFSKTRVSPVKGVEEYYTPRSERRFKRFVGGVLMAIASAFLSGTIAVTILLQGALSSLPVFSDQGSSIVSTFVGVLQIFIFTPVGNSIVLIINKYENYRKSNHFIDRLVWKEFALCFLNSFGLLFFSAIVKPVISTVSPSYKYFGLYEFSCIVDPVTGFNSCLTDLIITIAIIFGFKQFVVIAIEMLTLWYQHRKLRQKWGPRVSETAKQSGLLVIPTLSSISENVDSYESFSIGKDSFSEFNTPLIQLGNVLLFSCAFPLGPLLAWLSNSIEIKTDLAKSLIFYKRPFSQPSDGIGAFTHILNAIIHLGLFTQAVLLAFTSDGLSQYFLKKLSSDKNYNLFIKTSFVLIFENLLLMSSSMIDYCISDVPEHIRIGRLAEDHIARLREREQKSQLVSSSNVLNAFQRMKKGRSAKIITDD